MITSSTLRPGLLVSLKTSVSGNVAYRRQDIEAEHLDATGAKRARWETERTITDPAEHAKAIQVRSKCRSLVTAICSASTFGLLCPESAGDKLGDAVEAAQQLAAEFNAEAALTRISVFVIAGRIAADDLEAVRAINSEVRDLLEAMEAGIERLDVKAIREAADKARGLGQMLSPDAQARIQVAIDAARTTARKISKAGDTAAAEVDRATVRRITEQRTAFLDLEPGTEFVAPATSGRAVDFAPDDSGMIARPAMAAAAFEIAD